MSIGIPLLISTVFLILSSVFVIFTIVFNRRILSHKSQLSHLKHEQTEKLLHATIETQEIERKRIGANIHDDIGPILSAIKLQMNKLKDPDKPEIIKQVKAIQKHLDSAIVQVRNVSRELVPSVLYELGLEASISHLVDILTKNSQSDIIYKLEGNVDGFPKQKELTLFRIIQECLNNVIRHAKANFIFLTISNKRKWLIIQIKDDGIGFDTKINHSGLGMKNMEARTHALNGEMQVVAKLNKGTCITFKIPNYHD